MNLTRKRACGLLQNDYWKSLNVNRDDNVFKLFDIAVEKGLVMKKLFPRKEIYLCIRDSR